MGPGRQRPQRRLEGTVIGQEKAGSTFQLNTCWSCNFPLRFLVAKVEKIHGPFCLFRGENAVVPEGKKAFLDCVLKGASVGLLKGSPKGFGSHVGLSPQQDWDLRDWAHAGNAPRRWSRVGEGLLSNPGPALCTCKLLPFSEPQFPHLENGMTITSILGSLGELNGLHG